MYSLAGSNKENIESETAHIKSVYHVSCTHLQVPIKGQFWHWCTSSHRRWNYTVQYQMLHTRHSPCYFYRCLDNSESKIDMLKLLQNCNICDILIKWKKDNNECHWYFINYNINNNLHIYLYNIYVWAQYKPLSILGHNFPI